MVQYMGKNRCFVPYQGVWRKSKGKSLSNVPYSTWAETVPYIPWCVYFFTLNGSVPCPGVWRISKGKSVGNVPWYSTWAKTALSHTTVYGTYRRENPSVMSHGTVHGQKQFGTYHGVIFHSEQFCPMPRCMAHVERRIRQ